MTIQLASPVPNPCVEGYGALMFVLAQILSIMGGPKNTLPLLNQGFFQAFLRRPMRRQCLVDVYEWILKISVCNTLLGNRSSPYSIERRSVAAIAELS